MENEQTILNHYNLSTLHPTSWPTEKDESDGSENETTTNRRRAASTRSKSRYSALERAPSDRRSLVPGSEKIGNGIENLVQKDEADPLTGAESVVKILKERGLPVEDDSRLSRITFSRNVRWSADRDQETAFYCRLLPFRRNCTFLRSIPMPPPSLCCKVLTCSLVPLIRNPHPSRF